MPSDPHRRIAGKWRTGSWKVRSALFRFTRDFHSAISRCSDILGALAVACSLACVVCMIIYCGFERDAVDRALLLHIIRGTQIVFITNVLFNLILRFRATVSDSRILRWIVDAGVLLSLLPLLYPRPESPWLPVLDKILYSKAFLFAVLGSYSTVELCYGIMRMLGRRTNPALILAASFLFLIIAGSFVLILPRFTLVPVSYADALFVSTSAVCITGLTPVDITSTFSPMGLVTIAVLVQAGGLGVLTFTSFFAIFFSGRTSIYNELLIRDYIYSKSLGALLPVMMYILGFTLAVEGLGTLLVYFTIPDSLAPTTGEKFALAAFHALSSFCNAGFSTIPGGMSNSTLMSGNQHIYLATSLLIFAGGIGFPNLVNFKEVASVYIRRFGDRIFHRKLRRNPVHIIDLNTKLVLVTTTALFIGGAVAFFFLERHNTLAGMPLRTQIIQSVFNSLTPRSAGFASVNPASFLNVTLVVVMFLMWIGGASQSLAGGIKVNTFAAILLNLRAIVTGQKGITTFRRNLSVASVRRANAVVLLSILSLTLYCVVEMLLEPRLGTREIVFECVSALFTVGSSLGATPQLSSASKIVLCTAMFLGRVGILSLLCGLAPRLRDRSIHYPTDSIIIS